MLVLWDPSLGYSRMKITKSLKSSKDWQKQHCNNPTTNPFPKWIEQVLHFKAWDECSYSSWKFIAVAGGWSTFLNSFSRQIGSSLQAWKGWTWGNVWNHLPRFLWRWLTRPTRTASNHFTDWEFLIFSIETSNPSTPAKTESRFPRLSFERHSVL